MGHMIGEHCIPCWSSQTITSLHLVGNVAFGFVDQDVD
jgi:hypothetical protein